MDYCAVSDLYTFGLPRGATPNPGRLVDAVDTTADTLQVDVHGFAAEDSISFRAESGGTMPAPLVAGTAYFAVPVTESTFSVALTAGGAVVDLTTAGSRLVVIAPLPFAGAISWASRRIDDSLPAHLVPLEVPIHEFIKMTCAELAIGKILTRAGSATESLAKMVDAADKRLARWAKGVPLRGDDVPTAANVATSATAQIADNRGWSKHGRL